MVNSSYYIIKQRQFLRYLFSQRMPQPVANPDEALLGVDKMVVMDPRPPRPNSIELRRNYPEENSGGIYSPRHVQSPNATDVHYRWVNG